MQFFVGTSGYSYKEWKGSFYPEKLPQKEMLSFYGKQFSTVEMNNTFYRLPTATVVESWAQQVPKGFRFALKAPQTITHHKRLKGIEQDVDLFQQSASVLKKHLGPLVFQLPPNFKKDLPRLSTLLDQIKSKYCVALEFRHESWFDDEVFDCLRKKSCALCVADAEDLPKPRLADTANWGYVRLRREAYTDKDLKKWIKNLSAQGWKETYVYFKHEDTGTGPKFAARFLELAGS